MTNIRHTNKSKLGLVNGAIGVALSDNQDKPQDHDDILAGDDKSQTDSDKT